MSSKLEILEYFLARQFDGLAVNTELLSKKFKLTASAASHRLSRLREQKLIKSFLNLNKRNQSHVLTEKGIERIKWLRKQKVQAKKDMTIFESIIDDMFGDGNIDSFLGQ